ncbi:MAG TPA: PEGA domain-containing protein [Vicinamibacteria bacterium]|nr:PEGA domain-containing protein [Vicinamibacteria bacterium]
MKFRAVIVVLLATVSPARAAPDEDETGAIEVRSTPPGASVYIEGFFSGTTPAVVAGVPAGSYRIVIKHDGLGDFAEDIVVENQSTAVVAATLPRSGYRSPVREDGDYTGVVGKDTRKPYEKAKSQKKLSEYRVLEIGNFLVKSEDPLEPELQYTVSMGLFGGSSSGAMKEIGEDIAKAIEGSW